MGFVALAAKIGLQIVLGAFLAGVILNIVDRDTASHPLFRTKLDALGYGFLIPVFFVSSGVEFDLTALTHSPSALAKIPLFLLALLAMRGAPAAFTCGLSAGAARSRPGYCRPPRFPSSSRQHISESRSTPYPLSPHRRSSPRACCRCSSSQQQHSP